MFSLVETKYMASFKTFKTNDLVLCYCIRTDNLQTPTHDTLVQSALIVHLEVEGSSVTSTYTKHSGNVSQVHPWYTVKSKGNGSDAHSVYTTKSKNSK